ncbi:hypothetical protein Y032_0115g513 [Ancylostoma ceylanicum]|uniref:Uncharacterized protein n=1 Tax=Ancylostoma ceylanicum TaxID=53326 RepID=A0A016TD01_9BILA|nr:hypothetical protein Y032_0115g513 [Ancylostoma ceylanicum]
MYYFMQLPFTLAGLRQGLGTKRKTAVVYIQKLVMGYRKFQEILNQNAISSFRACGTPVFNLYWRAFGV